MIEFLYTLDKDLFYFFNQTVANPVFDAVMPFLTNLNKSPYGLTAFALTWLLLMWKGGKKGRIIGLFLIPLIFMSDQLISHVIKKIVSRPRPCHEINGVPVLDSIRLLVTCGSGYSFPSTHAVNNFSVAMFLSYYYRQWAWAFYLSAFVIGFSRISVGVHYPSDVLGGALIGVLCGWVTIVLLQFLIKKIPRLNFTDNLSENLHT